MQPTSFTRIAIIGAGASGSLLAVLLCRMAGNRELEILLFDPAETPGPGLAYSSSHPLHLLNVPAGRMSAFANQPEHFVQWLRLKNLDFASSSFVPRGLYGQYLHEIFNDTVASLPPHVQVTHIQQEITQLERQPSQVLLRTANGNVFHAEQAVLSLGNFRPGHPCQALATLEQSSAYAPNPWKPGLFEALPTQATVLLVGTGLTMVDMLMTLHQRQHSGPVYAVSTHGRLPTQHQSTPAYTGVSEEVARLTCVKEWLVYIRKHITLAAEQGIGWRAVIDAFRPYSQEFWLGLSVSEKQRFMRHLRHIWGVGRHRMPPENAALLNQFLQTKQLQTMAGRVLKGREVNGRLLATVKLAKSGELKQITADLIVNCTGPEGDIRKVNSPLLQHLLAHGLVTPDALHMGFAATPQGHLLNAAQQPSGQLFALGPPLKGVLWESTAIPEIREQAQKLAKVLLGIS